MGTYSYIFQYILVKVIDQQIFLIIIIERLIFLFELPYAELMILFSILFLISSQVINTFIQRL